MNKMTFHVYLSYKDQENDYAYGVHIIITTKPDLCLKYVGDNFTYYAHHILTLSDEDVECYINLLLESLQAEEHPFATEIGECRLYHSRSIQNPMVQKIHALMLYRERYRVCCDSNHTEITVHFDLLCRYIENQPHAHVERLKRVMTSIYTIFLLLYMKRRALPVDLIRRLRDYL
jgi:hypothetical protein